MIDKSEVFDQRVNNKVNIAGCRVVPVIVEVLTVDRDHVSRPSRCRFLLFFREADFSLFRQIAKPLGKIRNPSCLQTADRDLRLLGDVLDVLLVAFNTGEGFIDGAVHLDPQLAMVQVADEDRSFIDESFVSRQFALIGTLLVTHLAIEAGDFLRVLVPPIFTH